MQTSESCRVCEKVVIDLESKETMETLLELPNTYGPIHKKYMWKDYDLIAYAIIPQKVKGTSGKIDLYICIDKDDLGGTELMSYAIHFLNEQIFSRWENFKNANLSSLYSSPPIEIGCWRLMETNSVRREKII